MVIAERDGRNEVTGHLTASLTAFVPKANKKSAGVKRNESAGNCGETINPGAFAGWSGLGRGGRSVIDPGLDRCIKQTTPEHDSRHRRCEWAARSASCSPCAGSRPTH